MTISNLIFNVLGFIDHLLIPLVFAIAFLVFFWGIYTGFIANGADKEKRDAGKKTAMYGIIGFVLMFSIWGIIGLLVGSLGFDIRSRPPLPLFGDPQQQQQGQNVIFDGSGNNGTVTGYPSCRVDTDCAAGSQCETVGCVPITTGGGSQNTDQSATTDTRKNNGAPCSGNSECKSDNCTYDPDVSTDSPVCAP